MTTVGVIGLGQMGGGMARAFAEQGRSLHVYDVRRDAADALNEFDNVHVASSAREVGANADVVVVSVYSAADSVAALLDPESGALGGQEPGKITIDMTTTTLDATLEVEAAYNAKGVGFLAAPVSGRPPHMTIMAGGDRSVFDRSEGVLAEIGDRSIFLGTPGAACIAKHINQFLTWSNFLIACEGVVAGAQAGIPLDGLAEVLVGGSGNSMALGFALAEVTDRQPPVTPASLGLVAKDVKLAAANLARVGIESPMFAHAVDVYTDADKSVGHEPFPVLLRVLAEHYGLDPQLMVPTTESP
jgi:3-hydroxyisobutyrate dehydrogenase-like beta-hydroxyacid dehydrogenase